MTCFELGFNHLANRHQAFVGMGAKLFDVISFIARGDRQNNIGKAARRGPLVVKHYHGFQFFPGFYHAVAILLCMERVRCTIVTRYHSPQGLLSLRQEIVRYLRFARGIHTRVENIIITNGTQEGLSLLTQLFVINQHALNNAPCHIVSESPYYSGAWHLLNYYQAKITPVAVDQRGMHVADLPEC